MSQIKIGTRGSDLALWQANYTKNLLEKAGYQAEIIIINTQGDLSQRWNTAFDKLEGKGFFTKELEDALIKKEIDVAVHSHKDLPTENPPGLMIAGVSEREDPSELLIIRKEKVDEKKKFSLSLGAKVGTSSARRKSQLYSFRPDVFLADLRGNVPTRVNKLREGAYDAILIAYAGVERLKLDLSEFHCEKLNPREFIPAPAQGALAWQIRESDSKLESIFQGLTNLDTEISIQVERKVLNLFDGGCQLPLGVFCETDKNDLDENSFKIYVSKASSSSEQPVHLFFESKYLEGIPEKIVEKIKNIKPRSVFVSKDFRKHDFLPNALSRLGFRVEGKSLIEMKPIVFTQTPECSWVFFSSKHAVKFFFQQSPQVPKGIKFGCISKATATELRHFGFRSDFIGQSTDTKLIGKQFSTIVGNQKVLFPIAADSLQSVQHQILKKENIINLPVYKTVKHPFKISGEEEVIVFTSPSNVDAFFSMNKWNLNFKAVAMGDATAKSLERHGVKKQVKPNTFDDLGLFMAVLSIS